MKAKYDENTIEITKSLNNKRERNSILSKNKFFKNDVIISIDEYSITFSLATLSDTNTRKFNIRNDVYTLYIHGYIDILPIGVFSIDKEESNADNIVVYFEDILELE